MDHLTREQALEKWGWNELKWDEKLWGPLIEIKKEVTKTEPTFKPATKEQIDLWISWLEKMK